MMNPDVLISMLIVAAVLVSVFLARRDASQQARANPVGTAKLQVDVSDLKERFGKIETKVEEIRRDVDAAPTKADIAQLAEQIRGVAGHVESVDQAVVRIEQFLINGGPIAQSTASSRRKRT